MAATPNLPGNPNIDGGGGAVVPPAAPPGTDMTGICFRDQLWLNTYPLDRNLVFDYFALSPFYDYTCNNEQLRLRAIHPLDHSHLSKMTGIEYGLSEVTEPHLFVIRKQKRDGPEKVTPMLTYYVLDGSIYQAPQLCNVFAARLTSDHFLCLLQLNFKLIMHAIQGRALHHISKAFNTAASKLEKIGHGDTEDDDVPPEPKPPKETVDNIKDKRRVDHILATLLRKLPPAPPPPPFPKVTCLRPPREGEIGSENQQAELQQPLTDPIIDQGPSKRLKV